MEQILGVILRTILLLMTGVLASFATAPSPQSFDARATRGQFRRLLECHAAQSRLVTTGC
jgi:hypothetical protein